MPQVGRGPRGKGREHALLPPSLCQRKPSGLWTSQGAALPRSPSHRLPPPGVLPPVPTAPMAASRPPQQVPRARRSPSLLHPHSISQTGPSAPAAESLRPAGPPQVAGLLGVPRQPVRSTLSRRREGVTWSEQPLWKNKTVKAEGAYSWGNLSALTPQVEWKTKGELAFAERRLWLHEGPSSSKSENTLPGGRRSFSASRNNGTPKAQQHNIKTIRRWAEDTVSDKHAEDVLGGGDCAGMADDPNYRGSTPGTMGRYGVRHRKPPRRTRRRGRNDSRCRRGRGAKTPVQSAGAARRPPRTGVVGPPLLRLNSRLRLKLFPYEFPHVQHATPWAPAAARVAERPPPRSTFCFRTGRGSPAPLHVGHPTPEVPPLYPWVTPPPHPHP